MGRPPASERKPYDVDTLANVAFQVFRKRGYDATSVDQIASAAGITKSSIYHHVAGKEELLDRGVTRALDRLFSILDEPGSCSGSYTGRISYIIERAVELELSAMNEVAVLLRLRGNTKVERRALERRKEFDRRVGQLVQSAIDDGEIRNDIDPLLATRLLFSMANWLTEWYDPSGELAPHDIARAITALGFDGLRGSDRSSDCTARHVEATAKSAPASATDQEVRLP
jgi:AcrR family transcriptional regulator